MEIGLFLFHHFVTRFVPLNYCTRSFPPPTFPLLTFPAIKLHFNITKFPKYLVSLAKFYFTILKRGGKVSWGKVTMGELLLAYGMGDCQDRALMQTVVDSGILNNKGVQ